MRGAAGVLLAVLLVFEGGALADDASEDLSVHRWDERPWTVSMNIGFMSPVGQLGVTMERSLTRNVAVAAGVGTDFLSGLPYGPSPLTRYMAAGRFRLVTGMTGYGLQAHAFYGDTVHQGDDHAEYAVFRDSVNLGGDLYVERRWRNAFVWRFMLGMSARVSYSACESSCNDDNEVTPTPSSLTLGFTFGWSF